MLVDMYCLAHVYLTVGHIFVWIWIWTMYVMYVVRTVSTIASFTEARQGMAFKTLAIFIIKHSREPKILHVRPSNTIPLSS